MTRRCSHCSSNGHNARTCSTRSGGVGVMLFGVRLMDGAFMKKSASMGNLSHCSATAADSMEECHSDDPGCGSDSRRRRIRKKGIPWTEEEHRSFLLGLQKLGKGDWRGISKAYVPSRTPSQVASHAQKYFIRQSSSNRKKKRSSLFDMVPNMEANSSRQEPFGTLSLEACAKNGRFMVSSAQEANMNKSLSPLDLSLKPTFMPLPFQLQPPNACSLKDNEAKTSHQQILRPVPVVLKPIKELVGISQLTLGERNKVKIDPPALSLGLPGNP